MIKEKHTLTNPYNHHALSRYIDVYELSAIDCAATQYSGYKGTEITLIDQTPAGYGFDHWNITGATLTGNTFILNNDVTAQGIYTAVPYTLTLQTDGNGTLTATKITGNPGDTVTLTPTYNTYYRFSGYTVTGGSINGNTFTFGNSNATAKAWFRGNTFTASGRFDYEDGWAGISAYTDETKTGIFDRVAVTTYTNNVPASWYTTSSPWGDKSLWYPTAASNYSMTAKPSMRSILTYAYEGTSIITASFKTYAGQHTVKTNISTEVKNLDYTQTGSTWAQHTGSVSSFFWRPTIVTTAHNGYYMERVDCYVDSTDSRGRYRGLRTYANTTDSDKGSWTATGYAP